ncbi:MAG: DUF177 domain-containing protein [Chloroflexi bacterium]|nr:DUF177 domain-containing protein [Chloroflexota bacterium]
MQFNVAQLLKQPVGTVREHEIDDTQPANPDIHWVGRLRGRVRFIRTGRGILVRARLGGLATDMCGRCLGDAQFPVRVHFEEEFLSSVDVITGLPNDVREERAAGAFLIDARHLLDLSEAVRQYALLDLPLQVVCSEACAGLCPRCGENLNEGPCACPPEAIDPRWAQLSELHVAPSAKRRRL